MSPPCTYLDWSIEVNVSFIDDKPVKYSISFQRKHEDGWYDEIRYDSHDRSRRQGRFFAPHFHMKLRTRFKPETNGTLEEIRKIIDNYLEPIEGVLGGAGGK